MDWSWLLVLEQDSVSRSESEVLENRKMNQMDQKNMHLVLMFVMLM
ncbi:hypothetical protein P4H71_19705 [Paenibacillus kribbensis]|nr:MULTISPECIES: hypothetical protein [Paenibacillus]EHS57764.1 hypothetical protein WG8_2237 [Paenibacillus sp. Aloe-11]MEC0236556.1 hypothetical protein [Paenibacillus kribbensis]